MVGGDIQILDGLGMTLGQLAPVYGVFLLVVPPLAGIYVYQTIRPINSQLGARWYKYTLFGGVLWSVMDGFLFLFKSPSIQFAAVMGIALASSIASVTLFAFAVEFGHKGRISPRVVAILLVPGAVSQFIGWFPDTRSLFITSFRVVNGFPVYNHGIWFTIEQVILPWFYVFIALAVWLGEIFVSEGQRRKHLILLFSFAGVQAVAAAPTGFEMGPGYLRTTGLGFVIAAVAVGVTLRRAPILEVPPLARRQMVDTLSDPILFITDDGVVSDCNTTAQNVLGDILNSKISDVLGIGVDSSKEWPNRITVQSKSDENEKTTFAINHTEVPSDSGISGSIVALRDVTALKRREEEVAETKQMYLTLAENFPDGGVGLFNDRLEYQIAHGEMFELEATGEPSEVSVRVERAHPEQFIEEHLEMFKNTIEGEYGEFEYTTGDRTYQVRLAPLETPEQGGEQSVFAGLAVFSDITDLKRQQEEITLLKQILSRVFRHNIRNRLTSAQGYAKMAADEAEAPAVEYATKVEDQIKQLIGQTEKTRILEKVIEQNTKIAVELQPIVNRIAHQYQDADVVICSDVDDLSVLAHPELSTAVQELIENAIEHTTPGDPESESTTDPQSVRIQISTTRIRGDMVVLTIRDDGPGIPENEVEVLTATKETQLEHGRGLGLWLVQWIVDRSGGVLVPERTIDGTAIHIVLEETNPEVEDVVDDGGNVRRRSQG